MIHLIYKNFAIECESIEIALNRLRHLEVMPLSVKGDNFKDVLKVSNFMIALNKTLKSNEVNNERV
tara:strand:+ start:147 stop:344 length:198 start_codon:yes stop_codon:yes gene_type:complete